MTIISSISLGVSWFDLSLLICQTMLIGLTDRKIKCRSRNTSGKQEKTGEREEPRVSEGLGVHSSLWNTSWVALKVSTGHSAILLFLLQATHYFYSKPSKVRKLVGVCYRNLLSLGTDCEMCCCSVTHSCPTLWDPMDYSTQGSPVLHNLPELAQTYVHQVSDAIQPSHPLSHPSPTSSQSFQVSGSVPMCQLFASVSQSTGPSASASVLPMNFL